MKRIAIILDGLAFFLLCLAILGNLFSLKLARRTIKARSENSWWSRLWKTSCAMQSFIVWAALLAGLTGVIAIQLKTEWFTADQFGQLLGISIGLGIMATAIWEATQHFPNNYWRNIMESLDAALTNEEQRKQFNSGKSILVSSNNDARKFFLKRVLNPDTIDEVVMGKAETQENSENEVRNKL